MGSILGIVMRGGSHRPSSRFLRRSFRRFSALNQSVTYSSEVILGIFCSGSAEGLAGLLASWLVGSCRCGGFGLGLAQPISFI